MNFTTNEVGQLNESLLNMSSTGEGQIKPASRAHHATSKLAKRKLENLIQNNQAANAQQHDSSGNNLAYNSFEEAN